MRSFGTEDRETQLPVAPQNQVYEYILFRGSDIKDIRVVNNVSSIPNDPAIVQVIVLSNFHIFYLETLLNLTQIQHLTKSEINYVIHIDVFFVCR